jgi:prophage regulatory protein
MSMTRIHPPAASPPLPAVGGNVVFGEATPKHHHVQQLQGSLKILRLKQLMERTGLSRSTIFEKLNPRSKAYDAQFPERVYLSDLSAPDGGARFGRRRSGAIGFLESELDFWIAARAASRASK